MKKTLKCVLGLSLLVIFLKNIVPVIKKSVICNLIQNMQLDLENYSLQLQTFFSFKFKNKLNWIK